MHVRTSPTVIFSVVGYLTIFLQLSNKNAILRNYLLQTYQQNCNGLVYLTSNFPEFSRHSIMSKLNWRVENERYKIYSPNLRLKQSNKSLSAVMASVKYQSAWVFQFTRPLQIIFNLKLSL